MPILLEVNDMATVFWKQIIVVIDKRIVVEAGSRFYNHST
jgi:hypothetical protein